MVRFISGEFFLNRRPNGGTVILLRTLWITTLIYFVALLGREALLPDRSWDFDWNRARSLLADSIPVYGAIFATTYALLYTRFASQWMYLAQQYNQMMATGARMDRLHPESLDCLHRGQAAFVEDADALHLAAKPMFTSAILEMLSQTEVRKYFVEAAAGGERRACEIEERLTTAWRNANEEYRSE